MTAALVAAYGAARPDTAAATLALSISAPAAGNALVGNMFAVPAGTRSFSGGTGWASVYDDGSRRAFWKAVPASSVTTVNANNGSTNADITGFVGECSGLATGGATQNTTRVDSTGSTGSTAWATDPLTLTKDSLVFCVSYWTGGSTQRTTQTGTGLTAVTGTGIVTGGHVVNGNEGSVMHVSVGFFPAGATVTGSGVWNGNGTQGCYLVAIEATATASDDQVIDG